MAPRITIMSAAPGVTSGATTETFTVVEDDTDKSNLTEEEHSDHVLLKMTKVIKGKHTITDVTVVDDTPTNIGSSSDIEYFDIEKLGNNDNTEDTIRFALSDFHDDFQIRTSEAGSEDRLVFTDVVSHSVSGSTTYINYMGQDGVMHTVQVMDTDAEIILVPAGDGTVHGTAVNDTIDIGFVDAQGDENDGTSDVIVETGVGYDTITTGSGNDTIRAGSENDIVNSGAGNDTIHGDAGDDWVQAGAGEDTIYGGAGGDILQGGDGADELHGGSGSNTLWGEKGDDTFIGGEGADRMYGAEGQDTVDYSGSGAAVHVDLGGNTTSGGDADNDQLFSVDGIIGSDYDDTLVGFDDQLLTGDGAYTNEFYGGRGDDTLDGKRGDDILHGEAGDDTFIIEDWAGNDEIVGGETEENNGGDRIDATAVTNDLTVTMTSAEDGTIFDGHDTTQFSEIERVDLGAGDDTVTGSNQGDRINTGAGNDHIDGGAGDDVIDAGDGDDTMLAGYGLDSYIGGAGRDTMDIASSVMSGVSFEVSVDNQGDGEDEFGNTYDGVEHFVAGETSGIDKIILKDTVSDRSTIADLEDVATGTFEHNNGTVVQFGGAGQPKLSDILANPNAAGTVHITGGDEDGRIGAISFAGFEEVEFEIMCFLRGTMIATTRGEVAVEDLSVGDLVQTMDHGLQAIRWIGQREVLAKGAHAPVIIAPGVLGNARALGVSPQHRILLRGWQVDLHFAESEVLVPAIHLVDGENVRRQHGGRAQYYHILFDNHEIIYSDGVASESFHPGKRAIAGCCDAVREEIFDLFPELRGDMNSYGDAARMTIKGYEARMLSNSYGLGHLT